VITIGTAGWSVTRTAAAAFPASGTHLHRYAQILNGVEINSSFYRSHRPQTYARWAASTPAAFRFAVKLPRTITHEARLHDVRVQLTAFLTEVSALADKLGVLLVQLPPSLTFDAGIARDFFALLRERHEGAVACEPRHSTWFTSTADEVLVRYRIGRVAADPAKMAAAAVPGGWLGEAGDGAGATIYYRLHGSPRIYWSVYEDARIQQWAGAIRTLPPSCDAWCIFDNTAAGGALGNALEMKKYLTEK